MLCEPVCGVMRLAVCDACIEVEVLVVQKQGRKSVSDVALSLRQRSWFDGVTRDGGRVRR